MFHYLHAATTYLSLEITNVFKTLIEYTNPVNVKSVIVDEEYKKITKESLEITLKNKDPHEPLTSLSETCSFPSWVDYWRWKANNVKRLIRDLLPYYDLLPSEFLNYLGKLDSQFRRMDSILGHLRNNNDMSVFIVSLESLLFYNKKLSTISMKEFLNKYFRLISYEFRQDNKEQGLMENGNESK